MNRIGYRIGSTSKHQRFASRDIYFHLGLPAHKFNVSCLTIHRNLQKCGKHVKKEISVPHKLTLENRRQRYTIFSSLITTNNNLLFLQHFITSNKKLVLQYIKTKNKKENGYNVMRGQYQVKFLSARILALCLVEYKKNCSLLLKQQKDDLCSNCPLPTT